MKNAPRLTTFLGLISIAMTFALPSITATAAATKDLTSPMLMSVNEVEQAIAHKATWQFAHPNGVDTRSAKLAPLYDGLIEAARATGKKEYLASVIRLGTQSGWLPSDAINTATNTGADYAVTRAWLDIYKMDTAQTLRFNPIRDQALKRIDAASFAKDPAPSALYLNVTTLAKLYAISKDPRFFHALESQITAIDAQYWDAQAQLFNDGASSFAAQTNAQAFAGLSYIIDALPSDHPARANLIKRFQDMSASVLAAQQPNGLWPTLLHQKAQANADATSQSLLLYALAWGINQELLTKATTLPKVTRGWQQLASSKQLDQADAAGAFLSASAQLLRSLGGSNAISDSELLKGANEVLALNSKTPRAYARLVPERADDFAWENDKVAFRVYGPALRAGAEDSGIDAWFKRVPYPIVDKWYGLATGKENLTYHQDRGEGYDTYHVGDTRGCGGIGLLIDGKFVTSDTYLRIASHWTRDDVAEFYTLYQYPIQIKGQTVYEHRRTRLRLGQRFSEIQSYFSTDASEAAKPMRDFPHEIVVGTVTQNQTVAQITFDLKKGFAAVTELVDGKQLGSAVLLSPKRIIRPMKIDARDKDNKNAHGALVTRVDAHGYLDYRSGFAWSGDGEVTTPQQWFDYLARHATK